MNKEEIETQRIQDLNIELIFNFSKPSLTLPELQRIEYKGYYTSLKALVSPHYYAMHLWLFPGHLHEREG